MPFNLPLDDWPADRALWLDVVFSVEESVIAQNQRERETDAHLQRQSQGHQHGRRG